MTKQQPPAGSPAFGDLLRDWRERAGLTMREAAPLVPVGLGTWSDWENARIRPSLENCARLAQLLERPFDDVIALAGHPPVRTSADPADRAARMAQLAALAATNPLAGQVVDRLPELTDREIETLLTTIEAAIARRETRRKRRPPDDPQQN